LKSVSISASNPFFIIEGDFVCSKDKKKLIHYFGCSTEIFISKSVECIGSYSFYECKCLNKLYSIK
jgi:hypothetical protein